MNDAFALQANYFHEKIFLVVCVLWSLASFAQKQIFAIGDTAPAFNAITHSNTTFSLNAQHAKSAVVLVLYRGYWCPYCNKEFGALNDSLSLLTAKGATVVAVTPETDASVNKTLKKPKYLLL